MMRGTILAAEDESAKSRFCPRGERRATSTRVVYLISSFRWSFCATADVAGGVSLAATPGFFLVCLAIVA